MSLLDTTDGIVMLGAYGWAYVKAIRKLFYNMIITFVSTAVALWLELSRRSVSSKAS